MFVDGRVPTLSRRPEGPARHGRSHGEISEAGHEGVVRDGRHEQEEGTHEDGTREEAGGSAAAPHRGGATSPNPAARAEEPPPGQRTDLPSAHARHTGHGGETHQTAGGDGPR